VSGPALPFASRIACRSEPAPLSFVLVTVKVAAPRVADTPANTRKPRERFKCSSLVISCIPP
jgi:hypothetical protein